MSSQDNVTNDETTPVPPVQVGSRTGQVKTFNPKKGYGFITVHGEDNMDVFVHQTNISPVRSTYRTLVRGEYVSFDISTDEKKQALNVRGVGGGTLRCDAVSQRRQRGEDDDEEGLFETIGKAGDKLGETKLGQKLGSILTVLILAFFGGGGDLSALEDIFGGEEEPVSKGGCMDVTAVNYKADATFDNWNSPFKFGKGSFNPPLSSS